VDFIEAPQEIISSNRPSRRIWRAPQLVQLGGAHESAAGNYKGPTEGEYSEPARNFIWSTPNAAPS
jgi:hypothetical protein